MMYLDLNILVGGLSQKCQWYMEIYGIFIGDLMGFNGGFNGNMMGIMSGWWWLEHVLTIINHGDDDDSLPEETMGKP